MTKTLSRDSGDYVFTDAMIKDFINQGIDRLKQTKVFNAMTHLDESTDVPTILPEEYHYILAIYASSRCLEYDERHYEALDRRNEFETLFAQLLNEIEADRQGELTNSMYSDVVTNVYFNITQHDDEVIPVG